MHSPRFNSDEPVYGIGVAAEKFNVSVHTLRLYEAQGLILPHKTHSGRRLYSQADLDRIACIRTLLEEKGLNIAGIRWLLALIPCWKLLPCRPEDRSRCPAFTDNSRPCWMVEYKAPPCRDAECRDCHVYKSLSSCDNFKTYLKEYWK